MNGLPTRLNCSREAIAAKEIGHTDISRVLSIGLTVLFLCAVFLVPFSQYVIDRSADVSFSFIQSDDGNDEVRSLIGAVTRRNRLFLKNLHDLEGRVEENSFLRKIFLPPLQYVLLKYMGQGNEKVVSGRAGWLYYRPGLDYLIGQPFLAPAQLQKRVEAHEIWEKPAQPDPLSAIIDFKEQLEQRGISLIVVPVPVKAAIQPENLSSRSFTGTLANRSWSQLVSTLEANNVFLFDIRPILHEYAILHGDAYLATDTHWQPGAMQAVAERLAEYIHAVYLGQKGSDGLRSHSVMISGQGDVSRMLTLPGNTKIYHNQRVEIRQIINREGEFWQPDRYADVLLLGDSFTNIYSRNSLGWEDGAGFGEQLSSFLQRPVDLLTRNDSGAYVTREMLAMELRRGRDRLAGKKLVIWQFSERELVFGNWKHIELMLEEPRISGFYVAPVEETIIVSGVVAAISRSPVPGSVPYRDNLVTLHLVDLQSNGEEISANQALVYGWGMRDNQLIDFAAVRLGDTVSVRLSSWETLEGEYGSYRRSPLDDEMMELELPNWGELFEK